MGGTGQPLIIPPNTTDFINDYITETYEKFVAPTGLCLGDDPGCRLLALYTPEQLAPLQGELSYCSRTDAHPQSRISAGLMRA